MSVETPKDIAALKMPKKPNPSKTLASGSSSGLS